MHCSKLNVAAAVATGILVVGSAGCSSALAPVPGYSGPSARGGLPPDRPLGRQAKKSLVYVSQAADNSISIFHLDGSRIGKITNGINYPQGLFADAKGTLYVANRGSDVVLEFKRGASSAFRTLTDGQNQPEDVAVCPNGTIYVANILDASSGGGNITVYSHGSRNPTGTLTYGGGEFFFLTCDAKGNVFATLVLGTTGTVVGFPGGQQSGATQLPILFGGNPSGIKADNGGNLLVAGQGEGVEEFTESGSPTGLQIATAGLSDIALSPDGTLLLGASGKGGLQYTFPGGKVDHIYRTPEGSDGVAFDPGTN